MYKFIFVDDEDYIREFFAETLDFSQYGFELFQMFSSAEQARACLESRADISAVITDIRLGGPSGIDLCQRLRQKYPDMLLVLLSGYGEFEYAQKAIRFDVFEYLLKPATYSDLDRLFNKMRAALDTRRGGLVAPREAYNDIVGLIESYIEAHYMEEMTLEDLAAHVSMNPAYLSRFFKKKLKSNFLEYLSRVRVQKAVALLSDPKVKVYEVSRRVGYKSVQHFYKIFKQQMGCTPSEFREREIGARKE